MEQTTTPAVDPRIAGLLEVLQLTATGNMLFNPDGRVVYFGGHIGVLLGVDTANGVNRPAHELLVPEAHAPFQAAFAHALAGVTDPAFTVDTELASGRTRQVAVQLTPIVENGSVAAVMATVLDVSSRQAANAALHGDFDGSRAFGDGSSLTVFHLDGRGQCTYMGQAWETATGMSTDQALGTAWLLAQPEQNRTEFRALAGAAHQQRIGWVTDLHLRRMSGEITASRAAASPVMDAEGKTVGYVGVIQFADIAPESALVSDLPPLAPEPVDDFMAAGSDAESDFMFVPATPATPVGPVDSEHDAFMSADSSDAHAATTSDWQPAEVQSAFAPFSPSTDESASEAPANLAAAVEPAPSAFAQPASTEPAFTETSFEQPALEQPALEQPAFANTSHEQPAFQQHAAYESVPEHNVASEAASATPFGVLRTDEPAAPAPKFALREVEKSASEYNPTIQEGYTDPALLLGAKTEQVADTVEAPVEQPGVDKTTGLANKLLFAQHVQATTTRMQADALTVSVSFIDLHGLEIQKSAVGQRVANDYLFLLAKRLEATIRSIEIAGRIEGNILAVLSINWLFAEDLPIVARRLMQKLSEPLAGKDNTELLVGMNLGMAVASPNEDVNSIFRRAWEALQTAKSRGTGEFEIEARRN